MSTTYPLIPQNGVTNNPMWMNPLQKRILPHTREFSPLALVALTQFPDAEHRADRRTTRTRTPMRPQQAQQPGLNAAGSKVGTLRTRRSLNLGHPGDSSLDRESRGSTLSARAADVGTEPGNGRTHVHPGNTEPATGHTNPTREHHAYRRPTQRQVPGQVRRGHR